MIQAIQKYQDHLFVQLALSDQQDLVDRHHQAFLVDLKNQVDQSDLQDQCLLLAPAVHLGQVGHSFQGFQMGHEDLEHQEVQIHLLIQQDLRDLDFPQVRKIQCLLVHLSLHSLV